MNGKGPSLHTTHNAAHSIPHHATASIPQPLYTAKQHHALNKPRTLVYSTASIPHEATPHRKQTTHSIPQPLYHTKQHRAINIPHTLYHITSHTKHTTAHTSHHILPTTTATPSSTAHRHACSLRKTSVTFAFYANPRPFLHATPRLPLHALRNTYYTPARPAHHANSTYSLETPCKHCIMHPHALSSTPYTLSTRPPYHAIPFQYISLPRLLCVTPPRQPNPAHASHSTPSTIMKFTIPYTPCHRPRTPPHALRQSQGKRRPRGVVP